MKTIFTIIILFVTPSIVVIAQKTATKKKPTTSNIQVTYGRYGCTASKYVSGSYEYIPKGSFTIFKNGTYTYNGFNKASTGKFSVDDSGSLNFNGGYFNGGKATPMEDRKNRYYLVFPTIPDSRWTCSLIN